MHLQRLGEQPPRAQSRPSVRASGRSAASIRHPGSSSEPALVSASILRLSGVEYWPACVSRASHSVGSPRASKRGDVNIRNLLMHGAQAMLRSIERKEDPNSCQTWPQLPPTDEQGIAFAVRGQIQLECAR
jgi:hypothetical protein